jgi:hypothetical protein
LDHRSGVDRGGHSCVRTQSRHRTVLSPAPQTSPELWVVTPLPAAAPVPIVLLSAECLLYGTGQCAAFCIWLPSRCSEIYQICHVD